MKEWMERAKEEEKLNHALTAKGLIVNSSDKKEWKPIMITSYDPERQLFKAMLADHRPNRRWNPEATIDISRINFCLDAEDPRKYLQRVQKAYQVPFSSRNSNSTIP